jgi:serine/threonine protein kinase
VKKPIPFGKYYLLDRIAVGGMAEVFKARIFGVEGFHKTVALKRILPNVAEDEDFITMFIDEAKIAVQLNHANIAQILELGDVNGSYFIAMEFVLGRDVRTIFERARRRQQGCVLTPQQCAYIIAKACEGLDYAHRKEDHQGNPINLVHRDISPQNILVSYEGDVKVIDFGVAKAQNKRGRTQAGILKGKFAYMSPEQVQGLPLDKRSDIFSLGILLHELLTRQRLFVGGSDFQTLEMVREAKATPPSLFNPEIEEALDTIVMKALAKDVNERYQSAAEMQEDLQRYLYSSSPVYSRKELAQFMKNVFYEEIQRDKERRLEYETFFEEERAHARLITGLAGPNTSSSSWNRLDEGSHPGGQHYGAPPQHASQPSHASSYPSQPQPGMQQPQYAGAPQYQQPQYQQPQYQQPQYQQPQYQQPQYQQPQYQQPHTGSVPNFPAPNQSGVEYPSQRPNYDAPLPETSVLNLGNMPPQQGQPLDSEQEFLTGEDLPLDELIPDDLVIDEGNDTVMDAAIDEEDTGWSTKKIVLVAVVTAILLSLVVGGVMYVFRPTQKPNSFKEDPGIITLRFKNSLQGVKLLLNRRPIPASMKKRISNRALQLIFKEANSYILEMRKKGHKPIFKRLAISMDEELTVRNIDFKPLFGMLAIKTKPAGATVFVNGKVQKEKSPAAYKVTSGVPLKVGVYIQGKTAHEFSLKVGPNQTVNRSFKLSRSRATLKVLCKKGNAKIYFNRSRRAKKTPYTFKRLSAFKKYEVRVVPEKYKPFKTMVEFPYNPNKTLNVDCTPPVKKVQPGILELRATPKAFVFINGHKIGETPYRIQLQAGAYNIKFVQKKNPSKILMFKRYSVNPGPNTLLVLPNRWR